MGDRGESVGDGDGSEVLSVSEERDGDDEGDAVESVGILVGFGFQISPK